MKPELTYYCDDEGTFVQGILEGEPFTRTSVTIESRTSTLIFKKQRKVKVLVGFNSQSGSFSAEATKNLPLISPDDYPVLAMANVGIIYDRETFENKTITAVKKDGASVQTREKPPKPDEEYTPVESESESDDLDQIEF